MSFLSLVTFLILLISLDASETQNKRSKNSSFFQFVKLCLPSAFSGTLGPHLHTRAALNQDLNLGVYPGPDLGPLGPESEQGRDPEVAAGSFSSLIC